MNIVDIDPVGLALARCSALSVPEIEMLFARHEKPLAGNVPAVDPLVLRADGTTQVGWFRYRTSA